MLLVDFVHYSSAFNFVAVFAGGICIFTRTGLWPPTPTINRGFGKRFKESVS
jgi:hypothetical protein